ncbi:probetacellulin [Salarias fasciatus]|uniref:Probetacellulin-like n=1 Tax=Salarias fasciatus TaxID=181472 RepID=A0A672IID7_SALFA|nr:probetacellulin-like [Salarias fasciatus]
MAWALRLCVGLVTALAVWRHCCVAEGNTTQPASTAGTRCHRHGDADNCTDAPDPGWTGHFSQCPDHLRYYCVHGECRYIQEQNAPSCRCDFDYEGHRCEFLRLPLGPEKQQIIIICTVIGLLLLILIIVFICLSPRRRWRMCWRRGRRREEPRNGTEKLSMMDGAAETHIALKTLDSREPVPHEDTNADADADANGEAV